MRLGRIQRNHYVNAAVNELPYDILGFVVTWAAAHSSRARATRRDWLQRRLMNNR